MHIDIERGFENHIEDHFVEHMKEQTEEQERRYLFNFCSASCKQDLQLASHPNQIEY